MPVNTLYRWAYCFCLCLPAVGWGWSGPIWAAPFISEIILPATGTTGVEIDGLDDAGATLLVVNASRTSLRVQHVFSLPAADQTFLGRGTAVVTGPGWDSAMPNAGDLATTVPSDAALFSTDLPAYLVLLQGHSPISNSASLETLNSAYFADTPILDWVGFAIDPNPQPTFPPVEPTAQTLATLNIAHLPRPSVSTAGATALARAVTADGPVLGSLLRGNTQAIDADPLGLRDFAFSPGKSNPLTTLADEEPPHMPEPAAGILLTMGIVGLTLRSKPRPCRVARAMQPLFVTADEPMIDISTPTDRARSTLADT